MKVGEEYRNLCKRLFGDLFVLEIANNHWGSLERGYKLIEEYSKVVRYNGVKAAIKLQIRDVDNFIHKDYADREDLRYISKTRATKMTKKQHQKMVQKIKQGGCIPMATAFDETAVEWAVELGCEILKIASSDINDWFLLQKLVSIKKPIIASTGGATLKDIDDMVKFFVNRQIPLAINHCVSNYPSEDHELELNQIDFLVKRYPDIVIGHSTHEYTDWANSMLISYAKGARSWERHVDIPYPEGHVQKEVSKYCSLPHQMDEYFKAFHKAREMCGTSHEQRRIIETKEKKYLDALKRGVYFKKNFPKGHTLKVDDVYLAVPLRKGQISSKEFMEGDVLEEAVKTDTPLLVSQIKSEYLKNSWSHNMIKDRGIE
ncbi:N-acetylneuraminic acid synthase [Candidatus Pacearchaeota archaeon]|nr:N-acetylneuraminic acid synthase [Candidatus Pacearchaeota archaeon]|tara:strand:+ start:3629 stop:4750 length:1122 start_codon:yes stop_codon:yes gene_type:complete